MNKKTKKSATKNADVITYQLPQPCIAKYLVMVVDRGIVSEVNYFDSLEEAKRAFEEIAHDYDYEPEEINGSDKYDVSIWKWTEERYKRFCVSKISGIFHPPIPPVKGGKVPSPLVGEGLGEGYFRVKEM